MRRKKRFPITALAILVMLIFLIIKSSSALSELLVIDSPSIFPTPGFSTRDPSEGTVLNPDPRKALSPDALEEADLEPSPATSVLLPSATRLYSPNAIVIDLDSKELLLEKGSEDRIYPASLTKIMTVITALENLEDLDKEVLIRKELYDRLTAENSSMAGFLPQERVPAIDLLYGAMLPSGGECCMSLAEYISGSEAEFVRLMNQKASDLGMDQTHFTNTTGLHDSEHYTSVRDLAVLLQYSLLNDSFRQIFTSQRYTSSATNLHPDGITMYSTMFKNLPNNISLEVNLLGGKTGYTSKAGLCLASLAEVGGKEYIMISAGAEGNKATEQFHITDALSVYALIKHRQFADKP